MNIHDATESAYKNGYNKGINDAVRKIAELDSIEDIKKEVSEQNNDKFIFDYGVVVYKHRFSINRSLDDYQETTLNKCIRMGVVYKYKTVACDKLIAEMQIVYKDENDKVQCLCEDLHDYTFEIKHKGDMKVVL